MRVRMHVICMHTYAYQPSIVSSSWARRITIATKCVVNRKHCMKFASIPKGLTTKPSKWHLTKEERLQWNFLKQEKQTNYTSIWQLPIIPFTIQNICGILFTIVRSTSLLENSDRLTGNCVWSNFLVYVCVCGYLHASKWTPRKFPLLLLCVYVYTHIFFITQFKLIGHSIELNKTKKKYQIKNNSLSWTLILSGPEKIIIKPFTFTENCVSICFGDKFSLTFCHSC